MWNLDVFYNLVLYTILQKGYIVFVFQKFSFCDSHWKPGGSREDQTFLLSELQKLAWGMWSNVWPIRGLWQGFGLFFKETRTRGQSSRDLCSRVYPDRVLTRQSPGSMCVLTHSVSLAFFSKHVTPHPQLILRATFFPLGQFLTPSFWIWHMLFDKSCRYEYFSEESDVHTCYLVIRHTSKPEFKFQFTGFKTIF